MTRSIRRSLAAALVVLAAALPAGAQVRTVSSAAPSAAAASLVVASHNVTATAAARPGAAPRASVLPGDVLRFTLTFTNATAKPVRNVELRDPIPAGVRYVAGSARSSRADARLEFSADGGRSWSAAPTESVVVDGKAMTRAVAPDRFTHVRWVVTGAVVPGAVVTADFEARVNGAGA